MSPEPADGGAGAGIEADPDLRAVFEAWPTLPEDVKKMITGVVKLTPKVGT